VTGLDYKTKFEKGVTLLEALVSTAIVAIGFIAVFQMVQYSVQSIGVSGERTKASLLVSMVAEDFISEKNSPSSMSDKDFKDFYVYEQEVKLKRPLFQMKQCLTRPSSLNSQFAVDNKINKWNKRFSKERLKCTPTSKSTTEDTKELSVFVICNKNANPDNLSNKNRKCTYNNNKEYEPSKSGSPKVGIYDERYFARMIVNVSTGQMNRKDPRNPKPATKKKVLYFQID